MALADMNMVRMKGQHLAPHGWAYLGDDWWCWICLVSLIEPFVLSLCCVALWNSEPAREGWPSLGGDTVVPRLCRIFL